MAHCRNAQIRPRTQIRRRGITLLEVLISMFVALVGLAGLASLFWLGGVEMSEGAKIDRAMAVARAAQRTFKILGMHRPIQSYTTTSGGVTTTGLTQTWVALYGYSPTNAQFIDGSTPGGTISASTNPAAAALLAPTMPFAGAPPYYYYANANGGKFGIGNYTQGFAIDPIGVLANAAATPIPPSGFPPADPTGTTISVPPHHSPQQAPSARPIPPGKPIWSFGRKTICCSIRPMATFRRRKSIPRRAAGNRKAIIPGWRRSFPALARSKAISPTPSCRLTPPSATPTWSGSRLSFSTNASRRSCPAMQRPLPRSGWLR
jgi:type II secretory pathway pseudopilin PulG